VLAGGEGLSRLYLSSRHQSSLLLHLLLFLLHVQMWQCWLVVRV
jgi:hypothetical protein